ncbi:MAG TPA: radical SAM protein [Bacteroidota bacterium]|nr:radical SAM protein [Bacteroidota bacterium]
MIALVNPRSTRWRYRIPLSVLSLGASLEGRFPYEILDGNLHPDAGEALLGLIRDRGVRYLGLTVMPGPQLEESIRLSRLVREREPAVTIIWGGYFPTLHPDVVLGAPYVDCVIRDQGDHALPALIERLERGESPGGIPGVSFKENGIRHNEKQKLIDPNTLPPLPYDRVDIPRYIGRTCLGTRTVNYHSSVGCPFLCGFCAVAASYGARWIGLAPERIAADLRWFRERHGVNAVEFHDNNFFTSERRTLEFAERIAPEGLAWWGEARPDTLLAYDDRTWRAMQRSGCAMIFMGAESGSSEVLRLMDKGGTQTPETVLALAERMREYGIVPEFSFVMGSPTATVDEDIERDIRFIRRIKMINPAAEIVMYVYSPVNFSDAELFAAARKDDFAYPRTLDDWMRPEWRMHDLRKRPVTPWLRRRHIARIRNFERVLNARYPTRSDLRLTAARKGMLGALGRWRYDLGIYAAPLEIALAQRLIRYRQPETEGF